MFSALLVFALVVAPLVAANAAAATGLQAELERITALRDAAQRGDDAFVEANLGRDLDATGQGVSASVVLARRAMAVCGWLRNDNDYGRAMRLAERVVQQLASMNENTDADRVERLYWEAMLQAGILDRKRAAFVLLQAAAELAPEDDRLLECQLQLADALAAFGR